MWLLGGCVIPVLLYKYEKIFKNYLKAFFYTGKQVTNKLKTKLFLTVIENDMGEKMTGIAGKNYGKVWFFRR